MPEPILIGLAGASGAGKDTTANFIEEFVKKSFPALSVSCQGFAYKMKWAFARQYHPNISMNDAIEWVNKYKNSRFAHISFPIDCDTSPRYEENNIKFRDAIAQFGTEMGREVFGENFWLDLLLPSNEIPGYDWKFNFQNADICLIIDQRFENEFDRIRYLGGYCWKIRRTDAEKVVINKDHASEAGLPDYMYDVIINNDDNNMDLARERTEVEFARLLERRGYGV